MHVELPLSEPLPVPLELLADGPDDASVDPDELPPLAPFPASLEAPLDEPADPLVDDPDDKPVEPEELALDEPAPVPTLVSDPALGFDGPVEEPHAMAANRKETNAIERMHFIGDTLLLVQQVLLVTTKECSGILARESVKKAVSREQFPACISPAGPFRKSRLLFGHFR